MQEDPGLITWRDVKEFVKAARLGESEYFRDNIPADLLGEEIWVRGYPAAYWIVGGSEGWYVHVARNYHQGRESIHQDLMTGKFWSYKDASFAADLVSRYMNGAYESVEDLVDEGKAWAESL